MTVFTIGFARKSASSFFSSLQRAGVRRLIDVRLNNRSQLAGFTKTGDLEYFLRTIAGIEYVHLPELAPTHQMLDSYRKRKGPWAEYEAAFLELLGSRRVEKTLALALFDGACLLCSEPEPARCHRRLVAEYLSQKWGGFEIHHLP